MTSAPTAATALVYRAQQWIDGDPILRDFRDSRPPRVAFSAVLPSGVDLVACVVARSVLSQAAATVAIVLPRGQHSLPVMLGAYLARWQRRLKLPGSVAIVSHRKRLREEAGNLRIPEAFDQVVPLARLGAFPGRGGRLRAAAMPFDSEERRGLSSTDHYLLFQRPSVAPVLSQNVIATVVVDATESSPAVWEQLFQRNVGQRRQVWVGELGNTEFEDFCSANGIRIFRVDWETIAAAAALGRGSGPMTTAALCQRAATLTGPGLRLCCHGEFDEELRDLSRRLALLHSIGRDEDEIPEPVRAAMRFSMLLRRLACPIAAYDEQAARFRYARTSSSLLRAIEDAPRAAFRGRWKRAYDSHWGTIKGASKRLRELAAEECPKWWAVTDRAFEARDRGERLRIVCQTKAEQVALVGSLVENGVVDAEAFGATVDVVTFADRLPPGEDGDLVTVYTSPLPPWRSSAYLSAENGRVEVLCYESERRGLVNGVDSAWTTAAGVERNHALLDALGIGKPADVTQIPVTVPPIVELEPFRWDGTTPAAEPDEEPDKVKQFWQQAVELYGRDVEVEEAAVSERIGATAAPPRMPVTARLVVFVDGSAVYLDESVEYDVIVGGGGGAPPRVKPLPPRSLVPGLRLALLPGAARGSIVQELMSSWDDRVQGAAVYDELWRSALAATVERLGVGGLARRLDVTTQTVEIWLSGEGWPQQRRWMVEILKESGHEKAWANRAAIVHYIRHTRGMHRLIGRVLNDAITETVVAEGGLAVRKLEQIVDQDLRDLFSAVRVLEVASVGEPEEVAPGRIGEFIDDIGEARGAA